MAQPPQKPVGLMLIGTFTGIAGILLLLVVVLIEPEAVTLVPRAAAALLAALAFVAAEATIRMRPWFLRAAQALVLAYAATVVLACASDGFEGVVPAIIILLISAMVLLPILGYMGDEWRKMLRGRRIPAPHRPRP
ncbi:MAG TPA: hypothetical protein VF771_02865 [Longimicrobiaceae bacterium]